MKKPSKLNRDRELSVLIQEQNGNRKIKKPKVNTKQFWQRQKFGAASNVRRIDPKTGEVIQEINTFKQSDTEWFNMRNAPKDGTVLTLRTETEDEVIVIIGYYDPDTGAWTRVMSTMDGPIDDEIITYQVTGWRLKEYKHP
jgi:hypothetical protein